MHPGDTMHGPDSYERQVSKPATRFDASRVVSLKLLTDARRLEIRLADDTGAQHVVCLPVPAAVELAQFISDACSFMTLLKEPPRPPAQS